MTCRHGFVQFPRRRDKLLLRLLVWRPSASTWALLHSFWNKYIMVPTLSLRQDYSTFPELLSLCQTVFDDVTNVEPRQCHTGCKEVCKCHTQRWIWWLSVSEGNHHGLETKGRHYLKSKTSGISDPMKRNNVFRIFFLKNWATNYSNLSYLNNFRSFSQVATIKMYFLQFIFPRLSKNSLTFSWLENLVPFSAFSST